MDAFYLALLVSGLVCSEASGAMEIQFGSGNSWERYNPYKISRTLGAAPEAWAKGLSDRWEKMSALDKMANITTWEQFLPLMVDENGRPVKHSDVFSPYPGGELILKGGGQLLEMDQCSPRDTTVSFRSNGKESSVVYFPQCIKLARCGGCCGSDRFSCGPTKMQRVSVKLIKTEVACPSCRHLVWKGFELVILEKHLSCRVQCNLNPARCGPKREFLPERCACECRDVRRCPVETKWDPQNCRCQCTEVRSCCCGLVFDPETCQCKIDRNINGISRGDTGNVTAEDLEAYLLQKHRLNDVTELNNKNNKNDNGNNGDNNDDDDSNNNNPKNEPTASNGQDAPKGIEKPSRSRTPYRPKSFLRSQQLPRSPSPKQPPQLQSLKPRQQPQSKPASTDSCAHTNCPPRFKAVSTRDNLCGCRPVHGRYRFRDNFRFRSRRRNRKDPRSRSRSRSPLRSNSRRRSNRRRD